MRVRAALHTLLGCRAFEHTEPQGRQLRRDDGRWRDTGGRRRGRLGCRRRSHGRFKLLLLVTDDAKH